MTSNSLKKHEQAAIAVIQEHAVLGTRKLLAETAMRSHAFEM